MSELILPKDPSNNNGINTDETMRFNFLMRFLNHPCLFSVVLCIKDYLNSSLSGPSNYKYAFISKVWKKDSGSGYQINNFTPAELFVMVANYEQTSFCKDCVQVITADCDYNIGAQQAIINNDNSTDEQKETAILKLSSFKSMKDNLQDYATRFLNYETMTKEIIPTLEVVMAESA